MSFLWYMMWQKVLTSWGGLENGWQNGGEKKSTIQKKRIDIISFFLSYICVKMCHLSCQVMRLLVCQSIWGQSVNWKWREALRKRGNFDIAWRKNQSVFCIKSSLLCIIREGVDKNLVPFLRDFKSQKSRRAKIKYTSMLAGNIPPEGLIFWWTTNGGCEELMYFEKQNTF